MVLQNRFRPGAMKLSEIVKSGDLGGELVEASAALRNWRPQSYYDEAGRGVGSRRWRVLLTQAIHVIDLLLEATREPRSTLCPTFAPPLFLMETEDLVAAVFSFESGAIEIR